MVLTSGKPSKCLVSKDLCFGIVPQDKASQGPLQPATNLYSVWQSRCFGAAQATSYWGSYAAAAAAVWAAEVSVC